MHRILVGAALVLASAFAPAQGSPPAAPSPDAGSPAVITLDFQGSRMKRINDAPTLSIYADGRVEMPQIYEHGRAYSGRISKTEVNALLDLIINQHSFYSFDRESAAKALAALPGPVNALPGHLATTVIRINTQYGSKTVRYYGLGNGPVVAETEGLLAIRSRLEQVMSVMKLGGTAAAARWLDMANRELQASDPQVEPLQLTDLRSAAVHRDGSAHVRFARVSPAEEKSVSVSISLSQSGQSTISVARNDLLSRPPHAIH